MNEIIILGSGRQMLLEVYRKLKEMELSHENFPFVEDINKARIENKLTYDDFAIMFSNIVNIKEPIENLKESMLSLAEAINTFEVPKIEYSIVKTNSVNPNDRAYKNKRRWSK